MPHNSIITASKPKRIFNYFLSLIGFDRYKYDDGDDHRQRRRRQQEKKQQEKRSTSSSSCSFLTASTLIVSQHYDTNDDDIDINKDKKKDTLLPADIWTLQSWLGGLSKSVLRQIVWMGMMQYHDSTCWPELEQIQEEEKEMNKRKNDKKQNEDVLHELKTIQEQANTLAHRLDTLRPSEQFAHAAQVAQEFQQLIRLCVHLLYTKPLAAVLGIVLIVQQSFRAPPEVRQHVYYHAKLGRLIVLELESILKYHHHGRRNNNGADGYHDDYFESCATFLSNNNNDSNDDEDSDSNNDGSWLRQLKHLCAKLARYDTTWEFRQEYHNVVLLAEQFYTNLN
ncbi:hypothetical protein INT45_011850 [Circinella minor]|uniref:Uncharacterized protein n=1 Tax=Circinella minor TaxID=1195481 RepID=A0A8H7VE28_9FUNG|nr:hypothetical protein INT45_011850 [Circinella minor]